MQTIQYNNQTASTLIKMVSNWIFPRTSLYRFINRNADVFEALCRQSAPFGGSVRGR